MIIKRLFKWAFRLFVVLLVLAIAALLLLDTIAREILEQRITAKTGLRATIGKMQVGLLNSRITIENLVVYNSSEFGGAPLIRVPELYAEYDRTALRSYKLHCQLLRLNIAEMNLVEDANGRMNYEVLDKKAQQAGPVLTKSPARTGYQFMGIDTLNLTLGRANFMTMKRPGQLDVLKADHNQVLLNVKSWRDLDGVLVVVLMKNGSNPMAGSSNPNDPWHYWMERLGLVKKK